MLAVTVSGALIGLFIALHDGPSDRRSQTEDDFHATENLQCLIDEQSELQDETTESPSADNLQTEKEQSRNELQVESMQQMQSIKTQNEEELSRRGVDKLQQECIKQLKIQSDSELKRKVIEKKWLEDLVELKQEESTELKQEERAQIWYQMRDNRVTQKLSMLHNSRSRQMNLSIDIRSGYNLWRMKMTKDGDAGDVCPICLEEFRKGEMIKGSYCNGHMHHCHEACIDSINEAPSIKGKCPVCRQSFAFADESESDSGSWLR